MSKIKKPSPYHQDEHILANAASNTLQTLIHKFRSDVTLDRLADDAAGRKRIIEIAFLYAEDILKESKRRSLAISGDEQEK